MITNMLQACGGKDPVIAAAVEQLSAEEARQQRADYRRT